MGIPNVAFCDSNGSMSWLLPKHFGTATVTWIIDQQEINQWLQTFQTLLHIIFIHLLFFKLKNKTFLGQLIKCKDSYAFLI